MNSSADWPQLKTSESRNSRSNCRFLRGFFLVGVRQSVNRGGASPGQPVTETQVSLRPCGWLRLCLHCCFRLPFPAASAVVGARQVHGRCRGRHRPSRSVEAGVRC